MSKHAASLFVKFFLIPVFLLGLTVGISSAAEFYLRAGTAQLTMPDNEVVTVWGFAFDADNDFGTVDGTVTSPGPLLEVPPGDSILTIHLKNDLPEAISLVIPGQIATMTPVFFTDGQGRQRVRSFTHETGPGATGTYTWTNFKPGTYLYMSGTHPAVQVQMGLYSVAKKDFANGMAYPGITHDREGILLFSEVDPVLHAAVANNDFGPGKSVTSTIDYAPKYFLFNGQADLILTGIVPTLALGEKVLVRLLNAGLITRVPALQGSYMTLLAEDGNVSPYPVQKRFALSLAAGKTMDVMVMPTAAGRLSLFDRRGFVSLGATGTGATPTQPPVPGLPLPPTSGTTIQTPVLTGGGGGGGCFISTLLF